MHSKTEYDYLEWTVIRQVWASSMQTHTANNALTKCHQDGHMEAGTC